MGQQLAVVPGGRGRGGRASAGNRGRLVAQVDQRVVQVPRQGARQLFGRTS